LGAVRLSPLKIRSFPLLSALTGFTPAKTSQAGCLRVISAHRCAPRKMITLLM
jgi:hypothetical protein